MFNLKKLFVIILFFSILNIKIYTQTPEFKILFLQFSDNVKKSSFKSGFSYKVWKKQFRRISNPKKISRLLIKFKRGLKSKVILSKFSSIRKSWLRNLRNAVSISELAEATYKLEINLKWSATKNHWTKTRRLWVKRIKTFY